MRSPPRLAVRGKADASGSLNRSHTLGFVPRDEAAAPGEGTLARRQPPDRGLEVLERTPSTSRHGTIQLVRPAG